MRLIPLLLAISLAPLGMQAATPESAEALLALSRKAFQRNQEQEKHWNWTATENRTLVTKGGQTLQSFPSVTAESVIRSDGRRCNAVVAWGDGKAPYLATADPDSRCQAMDSFRPAFQIEALLESGQVKLSRTGSETLLTISPDKARLKSEDPAVRCAASITATVRLDAKSSFPRQIEGEVTENGCNQRFEGLVQYDAARRTGPLVSSFRKGAKFRMEFAYQKDRFQNPANSYWICVDQHYGQPWSTSAETIYYWGRQVRVTAGKTAYHLEKDIKTTAKEFGVDSQPHFDTVGQDQ